jgi:glycosyltransferase involved in cell wall biosynthesis
MTHSETLFTIGLPVRNASGRIGGVVKSILDQDHQNLELVISDNASTDNTEEVCRDLADQDSRIVYHRNPINIGLLNNFLAAMNLAKGTYFRWIGDDDWLDPTYVTKCLDEFARDDRLIVVTTQTDYIGLDGTSATAAYTGTGLRSDDPITRLTEIVRLLNESYLLMDACYGVYRLDRVSHIARRNMLNDDQVFTTMLALAGPWGHVGEVLARRHWTFQTKDALARKLGVSWAQATFPNELQCIETARRLDEFDLTGAQKTRALVEIGRLYTRRRQATAVRRGKRLIGMAQQLTGRSS